MYFWTMRNFPHTYVIIFFLLLISAILTWIIPGGEYHEVKRVDKGIEKTEMVYRETAKQPQSWQVFSALFKGFEKQAGIIVFILMIGGAFWILNNSRSIDIGILSFIRYTGRLERYGWIRKLGPDHIIITLVMLMFSIFGAVFGMSEETIAFVIIMVPLAISMGYDSIVGVCLCFVAAALGFAGAMLNPFTVGIAQGIAGLPLFSGMEYRILCWFLINAAGIGFVLRYAKKIKTHPEKSPVHKVDDHWRKQKSGEGQIPAKKPTVAAWLSYGIILTGLVVFSIFHYQTTIAPGDPGSGTGPSLSLTLPLVPVATGLFAFAGYLSLRKSVQYFLLTLLGFTILFLIVGVMGYQWYIMKIATLFFAMGLFSGISMNYSPNRITALFLEGVKDILPAALVVGLAAGIIVILEDGKIIDSILHGLASGMEGFGKISSLGIMYCI